MPQSENENGRYIVTVEYEVFANSREDAVSRYLIASDRYLAVRKVTKSDDNSPNPSVYQHEQTFYDDDGAPDPMGAMRHTD